MLARRTRDGAEEAITQEHHAWISGLLAGAIRPTLPTDLVVAIALHDNPWRVVDAKPRRDARDRLVDFVAYPLGERLDFYATGIDELERVDPYVAHIVSRHYSSFAGTRDLQAFQRSESDRRSRLEPLLTERQRADAATDLAWLQFFDVLSLHVCLSGPDVDPADLPIWLRDPTRWAKTPDGRELSLQWRDADELVVEPWPFADGPLEITRISARSRRCVVLRRAVG